ncbi:TPA: hypothetical protein ACGO1T_000563 [Streptococcus suis]
MFKIVNNYRDAKSDNRIIQIQSEAGDLNIITARFNEGSEDWDNISTEQIINKVHEWYYRTFLQGRFINEAVDITQQRAREVEELSEKIKKIFTDADAELAKIKESGEMSQSTLVELGEMVFSHEEKINTLEDKVHALENRNAFGD